MKKNIFLFVLLLISVSLMHGQTTHYQLPNNNFDNWGGGGDMPIPIYWYSFSNTACVMSSSTCDMVVAAGGFDNHHARVTGYNGTGKAIQLYAVEKVGRTVNGLLTTGKSILASEDLSDPDNYIYTQRNGACKWTFAGRPDSISLWARFSFLQNEHPKAMMRVHIHGDVDYRDVASHTASHAQTGKIANAYCEMINPATTPVNGVYKSNWTRFAFKFRYWKTNNQPISTPTLSNTQQPYYILTSVSTNKSGSVGLNDSVAFDAIYCIYDKGLASFKINGVEDTLIKQFFNDHEFITHEKTNNSGSITYDYNNQICYHSESDIPTISATAKSHLIQSINVTQATIADPYATITVMHNDSSTYVYTIHFTNVHPAVDVSLNSPNGQYTACEGETVTVTASGVGADNYAWNNNMGTNTTIHPTTSGNYTVTASNAGGCTAYATAYVTINPIPNVNITGTSIICEGTNTNLTATGAYSYSWSTGATSASINVSTEGTYTVIGTSSAGCTKTSSFSVAVQAAPTITIDGPSVICNGTEDTLTASGATNYVWNNGSATSSTLPINTGGVYTVTGSTTGGCSGTASITVQGKPTPTVTIEGPSFICGNTPATLVAVSNLPGVEFVWSTGETGNTLIAHYSGFYSVTASLNGCSSKRTHTLSIANAPTPPTVTSGFRCGSGSVTLTASSVEGTDCYWYASSTSQEVLATGNTFTTPSLSVSSTYYVSAQNSTCVSDRVPVTASIYPIPAAPTVSSFSQCGEGDITLTATSSEPVQWFSDAQGVNAISPSQHITQTTTFYAAVVTENNCQSAIAPLTVTIYELPQPPVVTNPDPICSNSTVNVTLSATSATGTNVKWYDSEMNYKGQGNTYQVRNVSSSTTYYATAYNSDCESDPVAVNIIKNPLPAEPTVSCDPLCAPGEATLIADAGGLSVKWFDADNNFLAEGLSYSANIATTTIFKAVAFDTETLCESAPVNVTAMVAQSYQGDEFNVNICESTYEWNGRTYTQSGDYTDTLQTIYGCDSIVTMHLQIHESFNIIIDTSVCGQFEWEGQTYTTSQTITNSYTSVSNCDSTVTVHLTVHNSVQTSKTITICSNQLPFQYGGRTFTSAGTTVFTITNAAGCDSTITLTLIVNPQPSLPNITPTSITNCGEESITLNGSAGTNGTICRWYSDENDTIPFMTSNSFQYSFAESTTIYASSYNANTGCESNRTPMQITINPIPTEPEVAPVSRCGAGSVTFTAVLDETATTCRWYSNQVTNNPLFVGLNFTRTIVTTSTFYVQSFNDNTGCKSSRIPVVATVNTPPTKPQTTPVTNCGPLTTDLADHVSSSNLQYHWYDQNGDFLAESNHYDTTLYETTTFYVSLFSDFTNCESTLSTLTVTINENYEPQDIYDTTCQNVRYQNYNIDQVFVTPGETDIVANTLSSAGCDSLVTLHLFVRPQITNEIEVNTCGQYIWGDSIYTNSGIHTKTFTAANGCDSVVTLTLIIKPSDSTNIYAVACEEYIWDGVPYTQSGTYQQTYTNMFQCDSIITLHLTINPAYHEDLVVSACEEYTLNSETFHESGDYTQQYTTANGCDSIFNLHLTIHNSQNVVLQDEVCAGSAYTLNGFDTLFVETGEYTLTHSDTTVYGCDSTTVLHLTVKPVFNTLLESSICYNENYEFNGQSLTESGTYTANLSSVTGCDSIITLHLTVFPQQIDTITAHTCYNVSYHNIGFDIYNPTESGFHYSHDYDMHDCDSTTVLHLIVHQPDTIILNTTLCIGETYTENGFDVTAAETGEYTYIQELQNAFSCDSIVMLNVTVNPPHQIELYDTVCTGVAYTQFGFDTLCSIAGEYTLTHYDNNIYGCDSTTSLHLTVFQSYAQTIASTICESGSYLFNGQTLTETGTYTANLSTIHGCDSIVTLNLTVGAEYRDTITAHICAGESYNLNGFNINQPTGTQYYQHDTVAQNGCDSSVVLHLYVHELNTTDIYGTICLNEIFIQDGFNIIPERVGDTICTRVIPTTYNCDSTVILHLTVNPIQEITLTDDVCAGSRYTTNDFDTLFTQPGIYTLTNVIPNVYGCDSIITLFLTVHPVMTTELSEAICFDDSFNFNGRILTETGIYTDSLSTEFGCDSIVTLYLTVYPEKRDTIVAHICAGNSYQDNGFNIETPSESGYYSQTLPDINNCDSTIVLHLFVESPAETHINASLCLGDNYFDNDFDILYPEIGEHTYTQQQQTTFGCDSMVYLHLTVNPTYYLTDTLTVCQSLIPYLYEPTNEYINIATVGQFDTVLAHTTTSGCDSLITLTLNVMPSVIHEEFVTLCSNSELLPYSFGDMTLTESGDYSYTVPASYDCDSTVVLHLTVNQTDTVELTVTACEEFTWNDVVYTESGDYTQTFDNMSGCDSTVIVHLTIFPLYQNEISETACGSYTWNEETYTESGDYTQHFNSINECDSAVTLHLTILPISNVEYAVSICQGETMNLYGFDTLVSTAGTHILTHNDLSSYGCDSTTTVTLTVLPTFSTDTIVNVCDMDLPFVWDNNEYFSYTETGDYDILFQTIHECDSVIHLHLQVNTSYEKDTAVSVCNGALPYVFCEGYTFNESGNYTINLQSANGCDSVWNLHLFVTPNAEHDVVLNICDNELPYSYNDEVVLTEAGNYDIEETDLDNCITITHLTLIVNPTYHGYDMVTVCEETLPYLYGTTPLDTAGEYDVHLNASTMCDSMITVLLTVIPSARGEEEQYVCPSDLPVSFGGELFEAEGVYEVAFPREGLCDSIVTFTLHEWPEYLINEEQALSIQELPYQWHGMEISQSGIYFDSLTTTQGCDSIYCLHFIAYEAQIIVSDPIILCDGETAEWHNMTLFQSGTYFDTITNASTGFADIYQVSVTVNPSYLFIDSVTICSSELPYLWHDLIIYDAGVRDIYFQTEETYCDSIYRLVLNINPAYNVTESAAVCEYELPYEWRGMQLTESGDFHDSLTTVNGCDSIFTINFVVYPSIDSLLIDTACTSSLPYLWRGLQITTAGNYYDTIPNAYGCQDVFGLQLTIRQSSDTTIQDVICAGETYTDYGFNIPTDHPSILYDQRTIVNSQGCDSTIHIMLEVLPSYLIETDGQTCENDPFEWRGHEYFTEGTYYDSLTTVSGCDSVFVLHLVVNPIFDVYVSDTAVREHEYTYESFVVTPTEVGTFDYDIQYYTIFGCDSIVHLTLIVINNEGIDDHTLTSFSFYPNPTSAQVNISGDQMRIVEIFNANGKLIRRENADSPEFTTIDVTSFPTGHYLVRITLNDGNTITRKIVVSRQ